MLGLVHLIRYLCLLNSIGFPFRIVLLSGFCFLFLFYPLFRAVAFFHSRYLFLKVLMKIMLNYLLRYSLFELNHFKYFTSLKSKHFSFLLCLQIFKAIFFISQVPQLVYFFQYFLIWYFDFIKGELKSFYHFLIH